MSLTWKSNFTGTEYRIFRGKVIAGLLKRHLWKEQGYGEFDGNMLRLKSKGFWKITTQILDIEGKQVLGEIKYHPLKGTATISYKDIDYKWQHKSWLRGTWFVTEQQNSAEFKVLSFWKNEGEIVNNGIPSAVVLIAMFVHAYYKKISVGS